MALAFSQQSFLTSIPLGCAQPRRRVLQPPPLLGCRASMEKDADHPRYGFLPLPHLRRGLRSSSGPVMAHPGLLLRRATRAFKLRLAKLALVAAAAGILTLSSVGDAAAAKSGGRIGGQAFRPSAPRSSGPRINNSRTNIYVNPPVAPPLIGRYGYGSPYYGGWGWSPFTFFSPRAERRHRVGGGFDFFVTFLVLGAVATVFRNFTRRRRDDEDDDF
ncbi:unnamed protein product [Spirodela intermedia]|uniref:Uncharacterized protein n=1 Tax=Spirodela intermedia TaxID=51605 RepID=A0A7I8JKM9_SPIIN|nr:unnamed protein product [Spirodela intermedia]CAA6670335.1 unnamed protein product [Spirodela intermedia]